MDQQNDPALTPCPNKRPKTGPSSSSKPPSSPFVDLSTNELPIAKVDKPWSSVAVSNDSEEEQLGSAELTLRFPRPVGNTHLANWISTSNPDIMRLTISTEDTGLSESTYELVGGTDTESQDDNMTESMSESDKADDVQSLDGTEHHDYGSTAEGSLVTDDADAWQFEQPPSYADIVKHGSGQTAATDDGDDVVGENVEGNMFEETPVGERPSPGHLERNWSMPPADLDEEIRSRLSLDYTQRTLGTPSITPTASRVLPRILNIATELQNLDQDDKEQERYIWASLAKRWRQVRQMADVHRGAIVSGMLTLLLAALVVSPVFPGTYPCSTVLPAASFPEVPTQTITAVPTALPSSDNIPNIANMNGLATTSGDIVLASPESPRHASWSLCKAPPNPSIDVSFRAPRDIYAQVPPKLMRKWSSLSCLDVKISRGPDSINAEAVDRVEDGFVLRIPQKDAHGIIDVTLSTTCQPALSKQVKVHFEKEGMMTCVYDMTRNLAQDLTELVPAAAQEAERRIEDARRSWSSAVDVVGGQVFFAYEKWHMVLQSIMTQILRGVDTFVAQWNHAVNAMGAEGHRLADATGTGASKLGSIATKVPRDTTPLVKAQRDLQLGLLGVQMRAKVWWLKILGQSEASETYRLKGKEYLASKLANWASESSAHQRRHQLPFYQAREYPNEEDQNRGYARIMRRRHKDKKGENADA